jgi:cob(I)alamin adenosyltransferase
MRGAMGGALPAPPMANRLSTITTRTGDDGSTGLADGSRLPKSAPRVHAMGEVDELNSCIGLLRAEITRPGGDGDGPRAGAHLRARIDADLAEIQNDLFDLGGELAIPGAEAVHSVHVSALDARLADYNAHLPRLAEFILPGGTREAAQAHVCRCVCRRAERALVGLAQAEPAGEGARFYLNRLSDLLFVLARALQRDSGEAEPQWKPGRRKAAG